MYRMNRQMRIEDFVFPYGQLDKDNEWVKLADLVPWDEAEEAYAKQFVNNGHPAHPARIALGALIIKQRLKCSDEWTVRHINENPYLQYFIGLKEYTSKCPFGASTMVEFRKRFHRKPLLLCWQLPPPRKIRMTTTTRTAAVLERTRVPSSWMPPAVRQTFPTRRISSF